MTMKITKSMVLMAGLSSVLFLSTGVSAAPASLPQGYMPSFTPASQVSRFATFRPQYRPQPYLPVNRFVSYPGVQRTGTPFHPPVYRSAPQGLFPYPSPTMGQYRPLPWSGQRYGFQPSRMQPANFQQFNPWMNRMPGYQPVRSMQPMLAGRYPAPVMANRGYTAPVTPVRPVGYQPQVMPMPRGYRYPAQQRFPGYRPQMPVRMAAYPKAMRGASPYRFRPWPQMQQMPQINAPQPSAWRPELASAPGYRFRPLPSAPTVPGFVQRAPAPYAFKQPVHSLHSRPVIASPEQFGAPRYSFRPDNRFPMRPAMVRPQPKAKPIVPVRNYAQPLNQHQALRWRPFNRPGVSGIREEDLHLASSGTEY